LAWGPVLLEGGDEPTENADADDVKKEVDVI